MAAPNNLSLHSSFSSSQQQHSLQTPDTSALFSSSPLPSRDTAISSHFNEDVSSLNSLEDLLSFSGITSADSNNGPVKRHFDDDVEFPDSKRIKYESQTSSTTSVIPSILPTSKFHQPINSPVNGGVVLPLVKSFSTPALSSNSTGSVPFPVSTQTSVTSHSAAIDSNASSNSQVNAGSVALLVQLYKHFQSSGDSNGMAKVHQQLLALHSQLASKAGAYLNSLTGSSTTNQFIGSSNPVSVSASNGTTATSSNVLSSSDYTNKMSSSGMSGINSGQFSSGFTSNQLHNKSLLGSLPSLPSSSSSITTLPLPSQSSATGLNPLHIHVPTTTVVSQPLLHQSLSLSTATPSLFTPSLSTIASIPRSLTNDLALPTGTLGLTVPNQGNHVVTQAPLKLPVSQAQSKQQASSVESTVKTSTQFPMSLSTTSTINSPSIVTHSLSNSTSSSNNLPSLTGLQVTAQTQANVLRAVYSYRIQRIQEFLNSLPPDQRPTTTNELKDLLIKNNILAKALPPDMIANLQQQVASAASSAATVTATVNGMSPATTTVSPSLVTATSNTQSIINPVATPNISALSSINAGPTSVSHTPPLGLLALGGGGGGGGGIGGQTSVGLAATVSKQTSTGGQSALSMAASSTGTITSSLGSAPTGPLPGVTLETLRTLCRLPEADLVRIPMPPMLLTVVQYMRANKWSGSSFDLPNLIQQAQDGLAKGKITTASPQPPFQSSPSYSSGVKAISTPQQLKQPQSSTSSTLQQLKTNNSSPLSQYMASVGMKMPPTTIANSSQTNKSPLNVAKPSLPQNSNSRNFPNKTAQENIEKERISALQKVLQSSEEARIAFRFQAHLDKLHQQISSPELERPFSTWQDLILRLLPYHVYREPELPSGAMEKADAVYEGIAGVLLSRGQGLMNQFQQILLREEQRQNNDDSASIVLRRLWLEGEKERKEEEERQKREAEQIAAELSAVGSGTSASSFLDSDPFMLDSDTYNDYPFLDQFWGEASDGLGSLNEFNLGIT